MSFALAFAGMQAVGTIIGADGNRKAARAARKAAELQQFLANKRADEVLRRSKVNVEAIKAEGEQLESKQVSSFAKAGVDVGGGSPLLLLEENIANTKRQAYETGRSAEFEAKNIRAGGAATAAAGRAGERAARTQNLGSLITTGASVAGRFADFSPEDKGKE